MIQQFTLYLFCFSRIWICLISVLVITGQRSLSADPHKKPRYKQAHGSALRMETINLSISLRGIFITQNLTCSSPQMKTLYSMVKLCGILSSGEHNSSWCTHAVHSDEHHVFSVWIWTGRHRWQYKMWGLPESAHTSGTLPPCFCILSYGSSVLYIIEQIINHYRVKMWNQSILSVYFTFTHHIMLRQPTSYPKWWIIALRSRAVSSLFVSYDRLNLYIMILTCISTNKSTECSDLSICLNGCGCIFIGL